jgi:hypothetical protein
VSAARALVRSLRTIFVAILVLAFHAPMLQDLVSLTAEAPCKASCCRSGKSCSCCHHAYQKRVPQGARWTLGDRCPTDCGQFAELPSQPGLPSAIGSLAAPAISYVQKPRLSAPGQPRRIVDAALFQRPPPVLI